MLARISVRWKTLLTADQESSVLNVWESIASSTTRHLHYTHCRRGWVCKAFTFYDAWSNGEHNCFFCRLPPTLECGLESRLGLEFPGFGMWHFLKLVVRGFLRVRWIPSLLHELQWTKINVISSLSNFVAELSLCTTGHTACCTW